MNPVTRVLRGGFAVVLVLAVTSCGGGDPPGSTSSTTPTNTVPAASNVVSVVVDGGPTPSAPNANTLYTSVTLCVPGSTTQCQTIDHIQVDTGSYGLRVLASVLTLALPVSTASNGSSLLECTQFVDGYSWGPVATADLQVSGESASSVAVQVIGDSSFSAVPDACSSTGTAENTVASFGANGIIGIGVFAQDCGAGCVSDPGNGNYYGCTAGGDCVGVEVPLTAQVQNPVTLFPVDHNGTIIVLPAVAAPGAATLTGSLIFGIDTETNNASGTQTILTLDPNSGEFTTLFNGQSLTASFFDTGTNGIFFNDSSIPECTTDTGFYCPTATQSLSATLTGQNGVSVTETFSVANAETLTTDDPTYTVLPQLGGAYSSSTDTFDWGLPFFYGQRVATAIEGYSTSVDSGPYVAF
jgi:hypothetical protein